VVPKPVSQSGPEKPCPRYHKVVQRVRVTKWSHYLYLGVGGGGVGGRLVACQSQRLRPG
jgi:hypothetical protein